MTFKYLFKKLNNLFRELISFLFALIKVYLLGVSFVVLFSVAPQLSSPNIAMVIATNVITIAGIIIGFAFLAFGDSLMSYRVWSDQKITMAKYIIDIIECFIFIIANGILIVVLSNLPEIITVQQYYTLRSGLITVSMITLFLLLSTGFVKLRRWTNHIRDTYPKEMKEE